jgi:uncharacterized membrane protein YdjX (TVP38/TMEM64 family)
MPENQSKKTKIFHIIAFPAMFIIIFTVLFIFWEPIMEIFKNAEEFKAWVSEKGIWAPLVFLGLQILQVIIFIIPGEVPQIAGGYLFGIWLGTLYSCTGIAIGSAINFALARKLGMPFVKHILNDKQLDSLEKIATSPRAQIGFFILFVIPGIPKDSLCYVAGLSSMRFLFFMLVSSIGRLFGIIGSAWIGSLLAEQVIIPAIIIMVIATVLFLAGYFYRQKIENFIIKYSVKPKKE